VRVAYTLLEPDVVLRLSFAFENLHAVVHALGEHAKHSLCIAVAEHVVRLHTMDFDQLVVDSWMLISNETAPER
jgi:hypothetical protein